MNILVLSDAFWPDHTGGISKSLISEVEELVDLGHRIIVVTRALSPVFPRYETRDGYTVYRYPSPSRGTPLYHFFPFFSINQIPKIVGELQKKINFDVAYVHNAFQAVGLSRCFQQVPYVYVFHAPIPKEIEIDAAKGKYGIASPLLKLISNWIITKEREALLNAKAIVVRSNFMKEEMFHLYKNVVQGKTFCIPLGVNTARFHFAWNPRIVRDELGLPNDRPIILTVRRLVARMGLENLILAMKYIIKQVPESLLVIGGKGYLEKDLREYIHQHYLQAHVKLIGFIPENILPKFYQAADLFVMPTLELEGFGLSTIEALSCGTPVIATPVGANPEVVGPLGKEFISNEPTPEALAERIIWFLKKNDRSELRKYCRVYCESNFNIRDITNSIEKVFRMVVDNY